jgi:hypothetical protein
MDSESINLTNTYATDSSSNVEHLTHVTRKRSPCLPEAVSEAQT